MQTTIVVLLAALTPLTVLLSDADLVPVVMAGTTVDLSKMVLLFLMASLVGYLVGTVFDGDERVRD